MLETPFGASSETVTGEPTTVFGLGRVLLRIDELQSHGLTTNQIAQHARVSHETIRNASQLGATAKLRPHTWATIARNLDVAIEPVAVELASAIPLSPVGQLILPVMLGFDPPLTIRELARRVGTQTKVIHEALYAPSRRRAPLSNKKPIGEKRPGPPVIARDATLVRIAEVLGVDAAPLRRAAKGMREKRPKQPLRNRSARVLRREGRKGLRRQGDQLRLKLLEARTADQLLEIQRKGLDAAHQWWETATEHERLLRSLAMLDPRPLGRFGLCRGCDTLTYLAPGLIRKDAALKAEYHGRCQADWHRSAQWAAWATSVQKERWGSGPPAEPQPQRAYGRGRRLNFDEIADYYASTVNYLQVVHRTAKGRRLGRKLVPKNDRSGRVRGLPQRYADGRSTMQLPETVAEVATKFGLDTRRLLERVEWVRHHLPDIAACNGLLAKKVHVLRALLLDTEDI